MLNWTTSREDGELIRSIVDRARSELGNGCPPHVWMDVTAAHNHAGPIDLAGLLAADGFDFAHDVVGIHTHLDRRTGELRDCFVPRYSATA